MIVEWYSNMTAAKLVQPLYKASSNMKIGDINSVLHTSSFWTFKFFSLNKKCYYSQIVVFWVMKFHSPVGGYQHISRVDSKFLLNSDIHHTVPQPRTLQSMKTWWQKWIHAHVWYIKYLTPICNQTYQTWRSNKHYGSTSKNVKLNTPELGYVENKAVKYMHVLHTVHHTLMSCMPPMAYPSLSVWHSTIFEE